MNADLLQVVSSMGCLIGHWLNIVPGVHRWYTALKREQRINNVPFRGENF